MTQARYRRTSSGVRWQAHQTAGLRGRSPGLVGIPDRQRLLGQFQPLNFSGEPVPLGRIAQN